MTPKNGIIAKLIEKAQEIMRLSSDPVHDLAHAKRTAQMAAELCARYNLSQNQQEALQIAAWWHDASRTATKRPSLLVMPLLDDMLSAFMLWFYTVRFGLFGSVAGMATRLIFCKSLGTGKIFTKIILRKENRILLHILQDADALDVLYIDRLKQIFPFVEKSWRYHFGYKISCWWMLKTHHLHMKTKAGVEYLIKLLRNFLAWIKEEAVRAWHVANFGEAWVKKSIRRVEKFLHQTQISNFLIS